MNRTEIFWVGIVAAVVLSLVGLGLFRASCVTFIDNYEFPFQYDYFTGKVEKIERTGYIVRNPFRYSVHGIDTRPYQVNITANQRILNARLVRFNPGGLDKFLEWHGRTAGDDIYKLQEILKSYAFDPTEGKDCPFLTVVGGSTPALIQAPQE